MAAYEALKVCEHFESILKGTFGPNGLDVLLKSSSGNILITNSGTLILGSLFVDHPAGQMVVDCIRCITGITGSGASYFVLVITEILREIRRRITSKNEEVELLALSIGFSKLEMLFDSIFMPSLEKLAVNIDVQAEECIAVKQKLTSVINTSFNGKFPSRIRVLFTKIIADFLCCSCSLDNMYQFLLDAIDGFSEICIKCSGLTQDKSHVVRGLLIPRQFVTAAKEVKPTDQDSFKFLVLKVSLEETSCMTHATFNITSNEHLDQALSWKRSNVLKTLEFFKQQGIVLIITTEAILDLTVYLCNQLGISVISSVPFEEICHLCKYAGIEPLCDLNMEGATIPDMFIGRALSCNNTIIGTKGYVHIVLDDVTGAYSKAYQIVIGGPSDGMCHQYYLALLEALKTLRMTFTENNKLALLPSSGLVEVALNTELQIIAEKTQDIALSSACKILGKSLLQVPRTLFSNSNAGPSEGRTFLKLLQRIEIGWKSNSTLEGIDGKSGQIIDPYERSHLEPLQGKTLLIHHILQCVSQLLRVDRIVGVTCITKAEANSISDSD